MHNIFAKLRKEIFQHIRQKETGTFIGGIKTVLSRSTLIITLVNFGLILITAYHTTIHPIFPGLPFIAFFVLLIFPIAGMIILDYIIIYPSEVSFLQHQIWKRERNPLFGEIEAIKADNKMILRKLEEIEKDRIVRRRVE